MQAQLAPLQHALCKLQYESKAVASQLEQFTTAASLTTGGGTCLQQMQDKAQALQQCIDDKLQQVWNWLCPVTLTFKCSILCKCRQLCPTNSSNELMG